MNKAHDVVVGKGHLKPLACGHPWVFAKSLKKVPASLEPGARVRVLGPDGRFYGRGFYSPGSAIGVRIASLKDEPLNDDWLEGAISEAVSVRERLIAMGRLCESCRLVASEGDYLPGLTVDRFSGFLVVQIHTAGMENFRELILTRLSEMPGTRGIVERSDVAIRRLEKLSPSSGLVRGSMPDGPVRFEHDGLAFWADISSGQKTGFYLDQQANRRFVAKFARDRRMLDVFSNCGAFALYGLKAGARSAVTLDSSLAACEMAKRMSEENGLAFEEIIRSDAAAGMRRLREDGRDFDLIVVDPPKFTKSRAGLNRALNAYRETNLQAFKLAAPGALVFTCSCSGLVNRTAFERVVAQAARNASRRVRVLAQRGAGPDHTSPPAFPEGRYLKCLLLEVR